MQRTVFLDRDGVLNRTDIRNGKPYAPTEFEKFHIFPDTAKVLTNLKYNGFALAVVTNQPDVGNGKVQKEIVEQMNDKLRSELPVDTIKVCYHTQTEKCECRKPKPGMLLESAEELQADLHQSYMIGDRWSDISAGKAAGCTTIFIDNNYIEELIDQPDFKAPSLTAAVDIIISQNMDK